MATTNNNPTGLRLPILQGVLRIKSAQILALVPPVCEYGRSLEEAG